MKKCQNCSIEFELTDLDREFLRKFEAPDPVSCPRCRSQRRTAWRNERNLFHRKCDLTGKDIVSIYSADVPYPIYEPEAWYGDSWEGLDYGMDFDFDRPFFPQFMELFGKVPKMATHVMNNENSPYVNQCWYQKNAYLCFDSGFCEDCMYSYVIYHSKNVLDSSFTRECEISYHLIDSQKCYGSAYLQDCNGCYDAYFSYDCRGCNNIAFCSNLRKKEYHIFNKPVSKEEWNEFMREFKEGSWEKFKKYEADFKEKVLMKAIHKADHNVNVENVSGDYLVNVKNAKDCYVAGESEDIYRCTRLDERCKDCYDVDHAAILELGYEGYSNAGHNIKYGVMSLHSNDLEYFHTMISCKDCFGCCGLKNRKYCIFNKQYSKEEYGELKAKIVEHMKKTGEYGQFFPVGDSCHEYNLTCAHERFPMTRDEVLAKGWKWRDRDHKEYQPQTCEVPDKIADVNEGICDEILACEVTGKNFKIIPQEFKFYKKLGLPIPRCCPDQRHLDRLAMRTPYQLWKRKCDKCGSEMETTYSPDQPETVYCEQCYLAEVY